MRSEWYDSEPLQSTDFHPSQTLLLVGKKDFGMDGNPSTAAAQIHTTHFLSIFRMMVQGTARDIFVRRKLGSLINSLVDCFQFPIYTLQND